MHRHSRIPPSVLVLMLLAASGPAAPASAAGPVAGATGEVEEGWVTAPDGARLFYQRTGTGPQVVIVPARLYLFEDFARLAAGRTLVAYDMRNRGRSDRVEDAARLTIQNDVQDLEAVRRHIGAAKFSTIGYSYLGLMVVLYATQHPDRLERLVQIGPVPRKFGTEYPAGLAAQDALTVLDQEELMRIRKLRDEGYHEKHPREYCEREWKLTRVRLVGDPALAGKIPSPCDMPNEWPTNLARHFEANFVSVQKLDLPVEEVKKVAAPTLTIHGTRDRNAPYGSGREWALTLPDARLITVDGAAHQAWLDAPWVIDAIDVFLKGAWPSRAEKVTQLAPK